MSNKLINAKKHFRASVTSLKVKLASLDAELEKVNQRFEDLMDELDRYKGLLELEVARSVDSNPAPKQTGVSQDDLDIASTVGIFNTLLRVMAKDADDFRLACESIIFPVIYEKIVSGNKFYVLRTMPTCSMHLVKQGREILDFLRESYETHVTDPETWQEANSLIAEWWTNVALPLIYGSRDDKWDEAEPYSLERMEQWRDSPADRPLEFPKIHAAHEFLSTYRDEIDRTAGFGDFELRTFSF